MLVAHEAKCKYHPVKRGPKRNCRTHPLVEKDKPGTPARDEQPSIPYLDDRLYILSLRSCNVWSYFSAILGEKYKSSLMQFFRNEKNTPFTQIIFLHIAILELKILQFAGERDNDLKLKIYCRLLSLFSV